MAASLQSLKPAILVACLIALVGCAATNPAPGKRELIVVGNDEKVGISDAGAFVFSAAGKDTVSIIDIGTDPLAPRILVSLPLTNSIFGPPVNLAITPDESLALVANSMDAEKDGAGWKMVPDNKLYVIDLTTNPPALIDTVDGRQAALRHVDQSRGQSRAGHQPRRQLDRACCASRARR